MPEGSVDVVLTIPEDEEIGEIVSDESSPSFEIFKFKAFHDKFVSPGTVVAVKIKNDNLLVGRIISSHEQNPHFTPDKVAVRHAMHIEPDHPGENLSITSSSNATPTKPNVSALEDAFNKSPSKISLIP